jgi:SAM-dependent methyltransferase
MTTQLDPSRDVVADPVALQAETEAFAGKVAADQTAAYHAVLGYLGDRLGLWQALASVDAVTSSELAERSGLAERYVREWLSGQAAAGYVDYDAATESFTLPAAHAQVLADEESPYAMAATYEVISAVWAAVDRLAHAYTTGEGIGWHEHDPRLFTGVERFFRTAYRNSLLSEWLPAVEGLVQRLVSGIRVVDVGCGLGTSTIMMAEAFPASTFVGVDYHEESVRRAQAAAEAAGVSDRVQFQVADAASYTGSFDLAIFFDSLHDMGDPVGAVAHARSLLAPGGRVLAVEPFAEDGLHHNLTNPVAAVFYAASSCLCVPNSISQGGSALGAQAGPARLLETLEAGGCRTARVAAATPYNLLVEGTV